MNKFNLVLLCKKDHIGAFLRVDLHNHTTRCNHATGSMCEYIQKAIDLGVDIYGFSDHAPMEFDKKYRMSFDQLQGYFQEIEQLQDEYKDQITILKALEVDYLPGYMHRRVLEADVDYLIGSIHFLNGWGFDNPEFIGRYEKEDINSIYKNYFTALKELASSQLFDVVAHLDLIKVFGYRPTIDLLQIAKPALDQIKKSGMSVEISSAGLRKPVQECYPSKELLEYAYSIGIDITFGSDAHSVDQVGYGYSQARTLAKEVGYTQCAIYRGRKKELVTF